MKPSSQVHQILDGEPIEVLLQIFADRVLVLVTQLGKVGSLIQATIPPTSPLQPAPPPDPAAPNVLPLPPPPPSIQLTPLLGKAPSERLQTLHSLYASQIATLVWTSDILQDDRRPVVVGIALRNVADGAEVGLSEHERNVFHGTMHLVNGLLNAQL